MNVELLEDAAGGSNQCMSCGATLRMQWVVPIIARGATLRMLWAAIRAMEATLRMLWVSPISAEIINEITCLRKISCH